MLWTPDNISKALGDCEDEDETAPATTHLGASSSTASGPLIAAGVFFTQQQLQMMMQTMQMMFAQVHVV